MGLWVAGMDCVPEEKTARGESESRGGDWSPDQRVGYTGRGRARGHGLVMKAWTHMSKAGARTTTEEKGGGEGGDSRVTGRKIAPSREARTPKEEPGCRGPSQGSPEPNRCPLQNASEVTALCQTHKRHSPFAAESTINVPI